MNDMKKVIPAAILAAVNGYAAVETFGLWGVFLALSTGLLMGLGLAWLIDSFTPEENNGSHDDL
jgi:hypothetical protein